MAGEYKLTIEQGADWSQTLTYKINDVAVKLTGYSARLQARTHPAADSTVLSLTTATGGGITLGGGAGTIVLTRTAAQTALLTPGLYYYDLELVSGAGIVKRLLEGALEIRAEVTR